MSVFGILRVCVFFFKTEKQRIAQEKAAKAKEAITQIYSADGKYEAESTESGGATPTEGDPQLRSWKKHNTLTRKTPNPNL
jgi:hypothetical protein